MLFGTKSDSVNKEFMEYERLRSLSRSLNGKIVDTLNRKDFITGAKKLGMFRKGVLTAGAEEELDVLMDYCLYNVFRGGMNTVQRYLQKASMAEDELQLLQAMSAAWYSAFQIHDIGSGYVIFRDFFTEKDYRVMDKNLSQSAAVGLMFAVRLIPVGPWHMTSGTGLPIDRDNFNVIEPVLVKFSKSRRPGGDKHPFSPAMESNFSAQMIRELLHAGAIERMRYEF